MGPGRGSGDAAPAAAAPSSSDGDGESPAPRSPPAPLGGASRASRGSSGSSPASASSAPPARVRTAAAVVSGGRGRAAGGVAASRSVVLCAALAALGSGPLALSDVTLCTANLPNLCHAFVRCLSNSRAECMKAVAGRFGGACMPRLVRTELYSSLLTVTYLSIIDQACSPRGALPRRGRKHNALNRHAGGTNSYTPAQIQKIMPL